MRDEAAGVLGDDRVVFADADAAGPAVDDPAADDGVVAVERHQVVEFLLHHGTLVDIRVSCEIRNQGNFDKLALYKRQGKTTNTRFSPSNW